MAEYVYLPRGRAEFAKDVPRLLTPNEIEDIVEHFPRINAPNNEIANKTRHDIQKWLRENLASEPICPSAIPELINIIIKKHNESLLEAGSPAGITAAEAIGASATQGALKTFHASGSSKSITSGIDIMEELIDMKKSRKDEIFTLILADKNSSYKDALNLRQTLIGSVINDFVKDYRIFDRDVDRIAEPPFTSGEGSDRINTEPFRSSEGSEWWYSFYEDDMMTSKKFLRLYLDVNAMYKHNIPISILAEQLESHPDDKDALYAIYSPNFIGIIDIYPTKNIALPPKVKNFLDIPDEDLTDMKETYFLHDIIIPRLKTLVVKGIKNLTSMNVIPISVYDTFIKNEKRIFPMEKSVTATAVLSMRGSPGTNVSSVYILFLHEKNIRSLGIELEHFTTLIRTANEFLHDDEFFQLAEIENEPFKLQLTCKINSSPKVILNEILKLSNQKEAIEVWKNGRAKSELSYDLLNKHIPKLNTFENVDRKNPIEVEKAIKNIVIKNPADIQKASEYIFIEAHISGINKPADLEKIFKETIKLPFINAYKSFSNNIHVMASVLGIEAARNIYVRELANTIANGNSYINPSNILFVAEFVTNKGRPLGTSSTSIKPHVNNGPLTLASYEKSIQFLNDAAKFSNKEDIRSVSASIIVGANIRLGTNYFDIGCKVDGKTYINENVYENFQNINPPPTAPLVPVTVVPVKIQDNEAAFFAALGTIGALTPQGSSMSRAFQKYLQPNFTLPFMDITNTNVLS